MAAHPRKQADPSSAELGEEAIAVATMLPGRTIAPPLLAGLVQSLEFLALATLGAALLLASAGPSVRLTYELVAAIAAPLVTVLAIRSSDLYSVTALSRPVPALWRILPTWSASVLLVAAAGFFLGFGQDGSRGRLALLLVAGLVLLIVERNLLARWMQHLGRQGRLDRRAVIVGGGEEAEALIDALMTEPASNIRICGLFDDRADDRSPQAVAGKPKLGTIAELVTFARLARIDLLIVSLPIAAETRLLEILKALWVLPVDIRLSALGSRLRFQPRAYSYIGSIPFLDLVDRPISGWSALAKRSFDLVIATIAILLLSPIMLATAIAVRLDSPGPILFRQKRYGFNNEVIDVLKFRSMYHHLSDPTAKVAVTRGDARVTRVGRFIRRTSIDELPQLFNVLSGTLSLVGPRPHAVNAHIENRLWDEVVDGYFARHKVKPGITGWAQINGWRGEIDTPEKIQRRVECDLEYIERWSVMFDLYIVLMTPLRLLRGENAY